MTVPNERMELTAQTSEAASSLRSPAATLMDRRSSFATR